MTDEEIIARYRDAMAVEPKNGSGPNGDAIVEAIAAESGIPSDEIWRIVLADRFALGAGG